MADDLTLKWDAQNNELYAEDSNGSRTPVPFSSVNTTDLTVDGDDGVGVPTVSNSVNLSLDTWKEASSNRPAFLVVSGVVQTDGTSDARMYLSVDESGGTSSDYLYRLAAISSDAGASAKVEGGLSVVLPPGAQYQINNNGDPAGQNQAGDVSEMIL